MDFWSRWKDWKSCPELLDTLSYYVLSQASHSLWTIPVESENTELNWLNSGKARSSQPTLVLHCMSACHTTPLSKSHSKVKVAWVNRMCKQTLTQNPSNLWRTDIGSTRPRHVWIKAGPPKSLWYTKLVASWKAFHKLRNEGHYMCYPKRFTERFKTLNWLYSCSAFQIAVKVLVARRFWNGSKFQLQPHVSCHIMTRQDWWNQLSTRFLHPFPPFSKHFYGLFHFFHFSTSLVDGLLFLEKKSHVFERRSNHWGISGLHYWAQSHMDKNVSLCQCNLNKW